MDLPTLQQRAATLKKLHDRSRILVLANVWDVASALIVEATGAPAIATGSAGMAAVLGYADGENISRDEMLDLVARIARKVRVPVTADLEAGYGDAGDTVEAALRAGAVGMNLEDSTGEAARPLVTIAEHVEQIRSARASGERAGVAFVINARTDVYLAQVGAPEERLSHALERGRAYLAAGADCVFVPMLRDADVIGKLVSGLGGPLNILGGPGTPDVRTLAALGVARVSVGALPMRAALAVAQRAALELRDQGTYRFAEGAIAGAELSGLLAR